MPPLPATKLHQPAQRRRLVQRRRLLDLVVSDPRTSPRLVLVVAPAGFGKTTFLSQWVSAARQSHRVAWLSLDSTDDHLATFVADLVLAVRTVAPEAGVDALALLDARSDLVDAVLSSLLNDLDTLLPPTIVALDDYHLVDTPEIHAAVALLIDNLPSQVTLAITTRVDPPISFARLRAHGELIEVRAADLRFTAEESSAFLTQLMGIDLPPHLVSRLHERTEGWVAGLQLAGISARAHTADLDAFVGDFTGSHRYVLDYLLEEVLDRQPERVRRFLEQTSVLDRMTAGLCEAVTGETGGQEMLDTLEREGLFVVPLDDERRWYRYHHLFADAVRARMSAASPSDVPPLHRAASRWLAENGLVREAVRHALSGKDLEYAADLVEMGIAEQRRRRNDHVLSEWAEALPEDVVRRRPLLAMFLGWSRLAQGDVDGVERWLDAADAAFQRPPVRRTPPSPVMAPAVRGREEELRDLPAMTSVYRAAVAQARGDVDATATHARHAYDLTGPSQHSARGAAAGFLGLAAWAGGDIDTAITTFTDAVSSFRSAGMLTDELGTTVVLAGMWVAGGRPDEARSLFARAISRASERPDAAAAILGDLHVGLADVLREAGELDAAADHLELARTLGDRGSLPENRHRWYTTHADLHRARGDLDAAVDLTERAERLYLPGYFPDVRPIAARRARLRIAQGRLADAHAWARGRGVHATDTPRYQAEYDLLTLARLLVSDGEARAARTLLDRILSEARRAHRGGSIAEALIVRALAAEAAGDDAAALDDLAEALALAAPAGHRRLFLDEGEPVATLLGRLSSAGPPERRTLARSVLGAAGPSAAGPTPTGTETILSDRELEVLRLLGTELSGPEIARSLYVSVNTLRSHTKHIFAKLDVNTRRAAVRRGAELGLI